MVQPVDAKAYYGYLFEDNKKPTKLLDALLRGIANYIIDNVGDKDVRVLSPTKLAAFYKAVGGNYDPLFVDVPHPSISYIFQAIGCQHTLQPTHNDFAPPSVPALTLRGFVRWEAIETLLGPEEHVPFLQTAVRTFAIKHPDTGEPFPIDLPTESFPIKPDPVVNKWHSECAERLRRQTNLEDSDLPNKPSLPIRPNVRSGYSHVRGHVSPSRSPRERQQGADYFSSKPIRFKHVPGGDGARPAATRGSSYRPYLRPTDGASQSPKLRRRSFPDNYYSPSAGETPSTDTPQPPADAQTPQENRSRSHSHPRHHHSPSTTSPASSSDTEPGSSGSEAACPKAAPCGETEGQPKRPASPIFVSVPPQASPIGTPHLSSPQRNHNLSVPRPRERTAPHKVSIDGSGNISAPFTRRVPVPTGPTGPSRSSSVRWGGVEDMPDLKKRRASINTTTSSADAADDEDWSRDRDRRRRAKGSGSESGSSSSRPRLHHARSGSHDGRYVARDRDSDRERRDRERDRFSDRDEKEIERRRERDRERERERSGRNPSPSKGMDWRRYIPEILR